LGVERVDHLNRDRDLFARTGGQFQLLEPGAVLAGQ
jgi:hypothetical protein